MYIKNFEKKYQEKWENAYLRVENARASRALRWAPGQYWLTLLARLRFTTSAKSQETFLAPPWPNPGSATDCTWLTNNAINAAFILEQKRKFLWSLPLIIATQCKHTTWKPMYPFQAISLLLQYKCTITAQFTRPRAYGFAAWTGTIPLEWYVTMNTRNSRERVRSPPYRTSPWLRELGCNKTKGLRLRLVLFHWNGT